MFLFEWIIDVILEFGIFLPIRLFFIIALMMPLIMSLNFLWKHKWWFVAVFVIIWIIRLIL